MIPVVFCPVIIWMPLEIIGCILQLYGFWIEPFNIKVTHQELVTDRIPGNSQFRLLHLGDLHLEHYSIREEKLNKIIKKINAEIILFSGDYLSLSSIRDKTAWSELQKVLEDWRAPLGVYGVTGSPAVDLPENFPDILNDLPMVLLNDELITIEKNGAIISLIGLGCTHKPHLDEPRLRNLLVNDPKGFRILLHHSPDLAPHIAKDDIDLQLSGHTHGGQFCLPFFGPLFTGSLYGLKFKSGRYDFKNLVLYITRGLGMEGLSAPRVRFLCPPEVIVWDIIGKDKKE
jgi:predicted MPP superfamily phosphohydrolase